MRLIALVHLDSGEGDNAPAQDPRTGPVQGGANDNIKESSTRPKSSPAVEVIGTESVTADPDAQLMRLLAGIARDKPGSWVAGLANVRIAPAP